MKMYLNVALPQPEGGSALRTPEILNSLIGLTSPPSLHPDFCKQESSIELMSPVSSTQGDDARSWTPMGSEGFNRIEQCSRLSSNTPQSLTNPHAAWSQPLPSLASSLLTPTSDCNPNSPENFTAFHHNIPANSPSENNQVCPKIYVENKCDENQSSIDNNFLSQPYANFNNSVHAGSLPSMNSHEADAIPYGESSNEILLFPATNSPELTSPISTVEETRMALVKEGLKLTITSKLQQINPHANNSNNLAQFFSHDSIVTKYELTPDDEERRYRRRERNKVAATKCRNKKKQMTAVLVSESSGVHELNTRLKNEVQRLTEEKNRLERSLSDLDHRSSCKHVGKSKILTQNYFQLTSCATKLKSNPNQNTSNLHGFQVDCSPSHLSQSSASPCSISSLLSPCDTKSFIDNINVFDDIEFKRVSCNVSKMEKKSPEATSPYPETYNSENIADRIKTDNPNCPKSHISSHRYRPYINAIINSKFIPKEDESLELIQTKVSQSYPGTNTASVLSDHERSISLFEKINPFTYPCNNPRSGTTAMYESQPCGDQFYINNDIFNDTNDLSSYCSDNLNSMDDKSLPTDKYQLNTDVITKRNVAFNNNFTNQNIERIMSYTNL